MKLSACLTCPKYRKNNDCTEKKELEKRGRFLILGKMDIFKLSLPLHLFAHGRNLLMC